MTSVSLPKALAFDVFGTVVDWRSSIARAVAPVLAQAGRTEIAPADFAEQWRARYLPALLANNKAERGYVKLDVLHREMLDDLLEALRLDLAEGERVALALAWHRLDPWPDVVEGLARLRRRFPIVTCSNGNVALMVNMSRHAGISWDAILGADTAQAYKPAPQTYQKTAEALGIQHGELCLVAAHHGDLAAARKAGLQCAFIPRPMEWGGKPAPDLDYEEEWEYRANSFTELADVLGCPSA